MKKLLFIALMFGFLAGNAQTSSQLYGQNSTSESDQYYTDYHPGYPIAFDQNWNAIKKPYIVDHTIAFDVNHNEIRKTDQIVDHDIAFDVNRNTIRKTDNIVSPVYFDLNRYKIRKPY